ncbi:hypothetical protein, partial [Bosea sp. (in: a-proteobacteria)]|uniref:hypothetical protein n=1 Tax=Bosea sp. (in: a-proteobacteria) TaxID=1871050 RepID=UPI004034842D
MLVNAVTMVNAVIQLFSPAAARRAAARRAVAISSGGGGKLNRGTRAQHRRPLILLLVVYVLSGMVAKTTMKTGTRAWDSNQTQAGVRSEKSARLATITGKVRP